MSPRQNILVAVCALMLIGQGIAQAEHLRNDPDFGSGFYMFVMFLNVIFAQVAAFNITSAVRKLRDEKPTNQNQPQA